MVYDMSEKLQCMTLNLRKERPSDLARYKRLLKEYDYLTVVEVDRNYYYIEINTEGDWESVKELTVELDSLALDIELDRLDEIVRLGLINDEIIDILFE